MLNPSFNTEKILLSKVAQGNEKAFAELLYNYHHLLGNFIMRLTNSEPITQEIVQDVFLKIWLHRHHLNQVNCFKAYLMVVAKNHVFNTLKQLAREKNSKKEWVNSVLRLASHEETATGATDATQLIDEGVALLPPQQQKVYLLSRTTGLRQDEIAMELNVSLETVKKHMVLALRYLKNHLRSRIGLFVLFLPGLINL